MFRTNQPVTDEAFFDREEELVRLDMVADALAQGVSRWLAILGPRKIGKSSLLLEFSRRRQDSRLRFVVIDSTEDSPISSEFFRRYALRTLDSAWGAEVGTSLELLARTPSEYAAVIATAPGFASLDTAERRFLLELPGARLDAGAMRLALALPDLLARKLRCKFIVAIDEFQELADLRGRPSRIEPFAIMRSAWQRHEHVAYVISGSGRSMLRNLIASKSSPFFQHFDVLEIGPLPLSDATRLLTKASPKGRHIGTKVAGKLLALVGTHPFYVQLTGDAMTRFDLPYDDKAVKTVLQDVLFSRTGRLALYFQMEFERLVGRSTYQAAVLNALAQGPQRLGEVAKTIGAQPGHTRGYIDRLDDTVVKLGDGRYALDDPTFALWLRWRQPGGSALPMSLVGDDAEREVAIHLAKTGFELVYQSRASRGAFDLLAMRGAHQLGVQAKRSALPLRVKKSEWNRMEADAKRFSWRWLLATVDDDGTVWLLDPAKAKKGKEVRLAENARIANVLAWLDDA